MKRRIIGLALALCMITLVFAACTPAETQTDTTKTKEAETTAAQEQTAAPEESQGPAVNLKAVMLAFGPPPADLGKVVEAVNEISLAKTNTTIEFNVLTPASYQEQVRLMLASAEEMDLLWTGTLAALFDYTNQVSDGLLVNLDDYIDQYGANIKEVLGEDYLNASRYQGHIYGITTMRDLASGSAVQFVTSLLEKYNLDPMTIKKAADLTPFLQVISENEPEIVPLVTYKNPAETVNYILPVNDNLGTSFGPSLMDVSSLEVTNVYASQVYYDACKQLNDWYNARYMLSDVATNTTTASEYFAAQRAFCTISAYKPGEEGQTEKTAGCDMTLIELNDPLATTTTTIRFMWSVPIQCQDAAASVKFLNMLYGDKEVIDLLSWGIEGEHYVVQEDGLINYPEGIDATTTGYSLGVNYMWGDQLKSYIWTGDSPTLWDDMRAYNSNAIKSVGLGFIPDLAQYQTEVGAISNVIAEYRAALNSGGANPEEYIPEFLQKLEGAGVGTLIEGIQAQIDDWAASK